MPIGTSLRGDGILESTPSGWSTGPTDEERVTGYEELRSAETLPEQFSDLPTLSDAVEASKAEMRLCSMGRTSQCGEWSSSVVDLKPAVQIRCVLDVAHDGLHQFGGIGPYASMSTMTDYDSDNMHTNQPTCCGGRCTSAAKRERALWTADLASILRDNGHTAAAELLDPSISKTEMRATPNLDTVQDADESAGIAAWERELEAQQDFKTRTTLTAEQQIRLHVLDVLAREMDRWQSDELVVTVLRTAKAIETGVLAPVVVVDDSTDS